MSIADQIQTIARREYVLLRTCAKAVDERLEPAVSNSPGLSSALSRVRDVLRNLDGLISERSDPPAAAREDPPSPAASRDEPEAQQPEAQQPEVQQPEVQQPEAQQHEPDEVEHLAEELLEEEDDHHAGELADNEDLRDVQARLRAKHALQEFNEQQT